MKNLLYILLDSTNNVTKSIGGLIGLGIAMFIMFKKSMRKEKDAAAKKEDEKNRMQ